MAYCRTGVSVEKPATLVARPTIPHDADSRSLRQSPLSNWDVLVWSDESSARGFYHVDFAAGNLRLGNRLPLFKAPSGSQSSGNKPESTEAIGAESATQSATPLQREAYIPEDPAYAAVYEPRTDAVYFSADTGLMRLDSHGDVSVVAGVPQEEGSADGPANTARFESMYGMAADGEGALVVAEGPRLRRVQVWVRPQEEEERAAGWVAGSARPPSLRRAGLLGGGARQGDELGGSSHGVDSGIGLSSAWPPAAEVQVSTLHNRSDEAPWTGVAFDAVTGSVIATTATAVYRLRLPPLNATSMTAVVAAGEADGATGVEAPAAGSTAAGQPRGAQPDPSPAQPKPLLVAGLEGTEGMEDGSYIAARFTSIWGVTVDGAGGTAWVTDSGRLRRIDLATGCVTTLLSDLPDESWSPMVLPTGCLAACDYESSVVNFIALGLPPLPHPLTHTSGLGSGSAAATPEGSAAAAQSHAHEGSAAAAQEPPLRKRMRMTISPSPTLPRPFRFSRLPSTEASAAAAVDPTADVVVRMSDGTRFTAHRAVLAAASEYFWSRFFGAAFAESSGADDTRPAASTEPQEVELPDADPEAFAVVLHCCYSTAYSRAPPQPHDLLPPHVLPPRLLRPVAELADRLLLPGLLAEATHRLLAATWPDTVADDLVWAEARSPGYGGLMGKLLEGLQAFHVRYAAELVAQAPESVRRLAERCPGLMAELYFVAVKGASG